MQIFKSTDEIEKISDDSEILRVTDIKQAVKNENRVNIFVNGKYDFSLDIAQLVDFKIKIGRIISEEELLEFKRASEFGKLYQRALEWALIRPRSEKETRDYLYRKIRTASFGALRSAKSSSTALETNSNLSDKEIAELSWAVISRLKSRGYLDDEKFAKWYIENRFVKKGISKKRLEMELSEKGVRLENIDGLLDTRDEKEEILKIIKKKRGRYDDEKLILYLVRQGFSFQLARETVLSFEKD